MTQTEATNIIIALRNEGWDGDKINAFIEFIETHRPTEEETSAREYRFNEKKTR